MASTARNFVRQGLPVGNAARRTSTVKARKGKVPMAIIGQATLFSSLEASFCLGLAAFLPHRVLNLSIAGRALTRFGSFREIGKFPSALQHGDKPPSSPFFLMGLSIVGSSRSILEQPPAHADSHRQIIGQSTTAFSFPVNLTTDMGGR